MGMRIYQRPTIFEMIKVLHGNREVFVFISEKAPPPDFVIPIDLDVILNADQGAVFQGWPLLQEP